MQRVRHAHRSSTRSTGSATICGSPCARRLLPVDDLAGERARAPSCRRGRAADARPLGALRLRPVRPGDGADLRAEGLEVTIDRARSPARRRGPATCIVGRRLRAGGDGEGRPGPRGRLRRRHRQRHDQPVAGRGRPPGQPDLFVAARQNRQASAPLFAAMHVDSLLVPDRGRRARGLRPAEHAAAVAVPAGDAGAGRRLGSRRGRAADVAVRRHLQAVWKVRLDRRRGPLRCRGGSRRAAAGWATCCATPTTATSACTPSRCWSPRGRWRGLVAPTTTSCSRPTTSCCWSAGPRLGGPRHDADLGRDPRVRPARPARAVELGLAHAHSPPGLSCPRPAGRNRPAGAQRPCPTMRSQGRRGSRRRVAGGGRP